MFLLVSSSALAAKHEATLTFIYYVSATPEQEAKINAKEKALKSYSGLRAWQKTQDLGAGDLEHRVDLNQDGVKERFVLHGGPARYDWYAIFTPRRGRWHNIGEANVQDWSKVKVLRARHHGWHDFAIDIGWERGRIKRYKYSWDIKTGSYDLKSEKQIQAPDNNDGLLDR